MVQACGGGRSRVVRALTIGTAVLAIVPWGATVASAAWKPDRNVELVVGTAPGSGVEIQLREIQRLLGEMKLLPTTSTVLNKPGGGNSVAHAYLTANPGNAHVLSMVALQIVANKITGVNPISYADVTPMAIIGQQAVCAAVKADSPIKSAKDLVERLKKDAQSLSVGLASSRGSGTHISFSLAMKAAGIEARKLKIVVFKSSGEALTAMLGRHVDVVTVPASTVKAHKASGGARVLAVGTEQRASGDLADVPTWIDQGINASFSIPYGLAAPPGLSADQIAFWDTVLREVLTSDGWKKMAERTELDDTYLNSAQSAKYWEKKYKDVREILTDLGMAK